MSFNPRSATLAYRIWAYCAPRGWNCTVSEVAEELGETAVRVRSICQHKKWTKRMRGNSIAFHKDIDAPVWLSTEVDAQGPIKLY